MTRSHPPAVNKRIAKLIEAVTQARIEDLGCAEGRRHTLQGVTDHADQGGGQRRRSISGLVAEGGFPPLTLQPVNFEQLYAQRMQELVNQQNGDQAAESGNGEAVVAEFPTDD